MSRFNLGHDPDASWIAARLIEWETEGKTSKIIFNVDEYHAELMLIHYCGIYEIEVNDGYIPSYRRVTIQRKPISL